MGQVRWYIFGTLKTLWRQSVLGKQLSSCEDEAALFPPELK